MCVLPLWMRIGLFCLLSSSLLILLFDLNALVAPVLKMLVYGKLFFIKTIPEWFGFLYTGIKKGFAKLVFFVGGWEAWSLKKLFRHSANFTVSFLARTVILAFIINLFFGHERKGLKNIPQYILRKIKNTWLGSVIDWWSNSSARSKRITSGVILCVILITAGQAFIGISILLFDIVWELLIALFRLAVKAWRWIYPIIVRLIPNTLGSFITNKMLPFIVTAIPVFRDDHRVLFVRFNIRERYRDYRVRLLRFSRAKRPVLRASITPLLSEELREKKSELLKDITKSSMPSKE